MGSFDYRHVDVFVGVDMAKQDHFAQAIDRDGNERFARSVANDQAAIEAVIDDAAQHGRVALVIDMPSSSAQLLLTIAEQRAVPVAYVTGLQMRRAAELYAGSAKTDPRDAWVLADFARRHADQLVWLDVSDELLTKLRILNGRDVDLAEDANRATNRARDALVSISPALERALGSRLAHPGVRDLLSAYPTPTALRAVRPSRIKTVVARRSPRIAEKVTAAVVEALAAQTVTLTGEDTWGQIIAGLVADLERVHTARAELGKQIEVVFLEHPLGQVLVTLCGFGPRTGARTLAEIGDPARFANGGRLAAYAGLAPVDRRSGKSINNAAASRRGNHRLKNALFLAAFIIPVAVGALLLTACGSDDSSSDTDSAVATAGETTGDFNDADAIFAQGMIPHHEQAVEMAGYALAAEAAASPEIVALATNIQSAQDPEITQMTAWLQSWGQPIVMPGMDGMDGMGSDEMEGMEGMDNMGGMDGMMSAEDMANLQSLSGPDFDTAWATMMIAHHEGAIAQAQAVKAAGSNPEVLVLADEIIAAQQAEIDQMRALLGD